MKFIFPAFLVIALVSIALGATLKNSFVSPFKSSNEASDSAKISTDSAALPNTLTNSASAESAKTTSTAGGNSYKSEVKGENIIMTGSFGLSTYQLMFTINLPRNGGDISGNITGTCTGTISGKAEKPNGNNESKMTGQYSGDCQPIPTLGFKTRAGGAFEGTIKINEGKANVIYQNKDPYETRGSFDMFF